MTTESSTTFTSAAGSRSSFAIVGALALLTMVVTSPVSSASRAEAAAGVEEYRLVIHRSNPTTTTTRDFVAQAFFKRTTRWEHGETIHPVDLRGEAVARREFSSRVLNRSVAAVRSYWQQRIFSGRELPPPEFDSDEAVLKYVASSPGAIGYVSANANLGPTKELVIH